MYPLPPPSRQEELPSDYDTKGRAKSQKANKNLFKQALQKTKKIS
jgi:hypothetical protein